jgi:mannose-6-phosphate isomerase-like protein (cupin superfamily)
MAAPSSLPPRRRSLRVSARAKRKAPTGSWSAAFLRVTPVPPLHVHPNTDEAFYVADGDATFLLVDRDVPVTAGGLVFVPRGTAHTVWNSGARPVRGLIIVSPGAAEHELVPVDAG